ncbi:MAG: 16S rRNA (adenine(1518)-N(6)/adenine(1519)-N(6))-dimethyltransferase RsmA [Eubacterium sp.]|nr:16S rRNA (adenine(1518)-N(6)/adenine(1519)-N(6))-dimethyltransferase RsmA [Eubacterium sp.]
MKLYEPQTIRYIKNKYGFRFSKSLGQNFLTDVSVINGIVSGAEITKSDLVVEIGPGIGVLTTACADAAGYVMSIEIDRELEPVLAETLTGYENIEIIFGDALKTDISALRAEHPELTGFKIVGNLPYYITTPILTHLVEADTGADSITIMMQKEVADRISAPAGSRDCGAISICVQYRCEIERVLEVGKEAFMPQPKVDSAVLKLIPRKEPAVKVKDEKLFFEIVKAGFSQRRKTLRNSLKTTGRSREDIDRFLEAAGIEGERRAETLTLEEFAALADAFCGGKA